MISFAFNLGNTGFDKLTNNGKRTKQEIAEKMLEYNNKRVDGKLQFSKGLDNRRKAEREKFLTK
jgi:GH24 family phage-related lysozyme (muramidase)